MRNCWLSGGFRCLLLVYNWGGVVGITEESWCRLLTQPYELSLRTSAGPRSSGSAHPHSLHPGGDKTQVQMLPQRCCLLASRLASNVDLMMRFAHRPRGSFQTLVSSKADLDFGLPEFSYFSRSFCLQGNAFLCIQNIVFSIPKSWFILGAPRKRCVFTHIILFPASDFFF